jgi:hypothetical protein
METVGWLPIRFTSADLRFHSTVADDATLSDCRSPAPDAVGGATVSTATRPRRGEPFGHRKAPFWLYAVE